MWETSRTLTLTSKLRRSLYVTRSGFSTCRSSVVITSLMLEPTPPPMLKTGKLSRRGFVQRMMAVEGLLQHVEHAVRGEAFDGAYFCAVAFHGKLHAAAHRAAIDDHRACAANAVLATDVGAVQIELVAQEIGEQRARLGAAGQRLAVDRQGDRVAARLEADHCGAFPALLNASARMIS